MFRRAWLAAIVAVVICWMTARAQQHPVLDAIADKVIHKYQQSSCEQLSKKKDEPRTQQEQQAIELLRKDPQIRTKFLNKVAEPIANKMFECGLIP